MRGGVEMKGDRRRWIGEGRWKMGGGVRREMGDRVSSVCWVMGVGVYCIGARKGDPQLINVRNYFQLCRIT